MKLIRMKVDLWQLILNDYRMSKDPLLYCAVYRVPAPKPRRFVRERSGHAFKQDDTSWRGVAASGPGSWPFRKEFLQHFT